MPDNLLDCRCTRRFGARFRRRSGKPSAWKVGMVLDLLETPAPMRQRTLAELSGGWQRLALIARVWVTDPDVLLLDEPTNHLDLQRLAVLENWINHATDGVAMVIASHDRAVPGQLHQSDVVSSAGRQPRRIRIHSAGRARCLRPTTVRGKRNWRATARKPNGCGAMRGVCAMSASTAAATCC